MIILHIGVLVYPLVVTSVCMKNCGDAPDVVFNSVYMPWNDRSTSYNIDTRKSYKNCCNRLYDSLSVIFPQGGGECATCGNCSQVSTNKESYRANSSDAGKLL